MLRSVGFVGMLVVTTLFGGASAHARVPGIPATGTAVSPGSGAPPVAPPGSATMQTGGRLAAAPGSGIHGATPLVGGDGSGGSVILVNARGTGRNTSTDPQRTRFEVPLYSLTTGEQVGRSTHNFTCVTGPGYCDDIDTYHLSEGTIVSEARVSFGPDVQVPGTVFTPPIPRVIVHSRVRPGASPVGSAPSEWSGRPTSATCPSR
jgi:hypothetical protein